MTLTLFSVPHSLYCAKTRILLRAKGLDFTEVSPETAGPSAFRSASPFGNLPAILHDHFALSDSEAIAEYLNEAFPEPPLLPADIHSRARMRERARFHDTRLEPALRLFFPLVASPDAALIGKHSAALSLRLAQLAQLLAHRLPFGLGDCGYPPTFLWIDILTPVLGMQIDWPQPVLDYRASLAAIPVIAEELASYRPHADEWVASKRG